MDPEATLAELRTLAAKILSGSHAVTQADIVECAERMAELFQAFDEWRINGGFLPEVWAKP